MSKKKFIFVSSSSDLAETRKAVAGSLQTWLSRQGLLQAIAPYLWEEETDAGRMLVDRMPIQAQLVDPFETYSTVPFVICMFGERCGVPLEDHLFNSDWEHRISPWRAAIGERGVIHPWPSTETEQNRALEAGGFPLTGTVFELISACEAEPDQDNLIIGYIASHYVDADTTISDVFFNRKTERDRLLSDARNPAEESRILKENYNPQINALINLIAFFGERYAAPRLYATESELRRDVVRRAQRKLRERFGLASTRNPFKTTLEYWTVDDERALPGRADKIRQILDAVDRMETRKQGALILIKGPSGCGKSSLLHRGVLAPLSDRGMIVIATRPTDLESSLSNEDHIDVLWERICERVDGCSLRPHSKFRRDEWMAKTLIAVLEERNARLVIGLDQFEEVLDELSMFKAKRHRSKRWWLVLRFLGRLSKCRRIQLIGTLENTRWDSFRRHEIEKTLNLSRVTVDAEVSADDAALIAWTGFHSVGINLDEDVLEEIKAQWDDLKKQQLRQGQSASPLPLACLRFAKLFEQFEEHVPVDAANRGDETASDFSRASESVTLSLEQIGGTDGIAFNDLIADLAEEAWSAAGQARVEGWPIDEKPDLCNTLSNFLSPLVGVDMEGHIRLLAAGQKAGDATSNKIRSTFEQVRLLVPAGQTQRSDTNNEGQRLNRLVHQSVVDRWEPARRWFEWHRDYLVVEDRIRLKAKAWAAGGRKHVRASAASIMQAAQVLHANKINWAVGPTAESGNGGETRDYAIMLFGQASVPDRIVSGSIYDTMFAHIACAYHLTDLLDNFWKRDPSFVSLLTKIEKDLFFAAAWSDGPAIPWLLGKKAEPVRDEQGWHPIIGAIQVGATSNYDCLIDTLDSLSDPIGPVGLNVLGQAARHGNVKIVRDLLERGANATLADDMGYTPLMWAALEGEVDAFRLLLSRSDVEASTGGDLRYTALHFAAQNGHVEIIRALLDFDEIDETVRNRLLVECDDLGRTPLNIAAYFKRTSCLRLLLSVCDPREPIHRGEGGATLHHCAVEGFPNYEEEKLRGRRTIEALIDDGRLDPNIPNDNGETPFELATEFPEAQRTLRQHITLSYAEMSEAMRRLDLQSTNPNDALRLIRETPKALTDTHEGKRGLDILIDGEKLKVLAVALREGLVADDLLRENWPKLEELVAKKWSRELRAAIVENLNSLKSNLPDLSALLDSALRDEDEDGVEQLVHLGANSLRGTDGTGVTIFHELAVTGEMKRFRRLAKIHRFPLPVDRWGRIPSDLASEDDALELMSLEKEQFEQAAEFEAPAVRTTKFHDFARDGDLRGFERQARGVSMTVPLDDQSRKPSDVSPEEHRDAILALETRYFMRTH